MKKIFADRIKRLDTLLLNKEHELRQNHEFANSPFTQGNINNLREDIYREKLRVERSDETRTKAFKHYKEELDALEQQIRNLRIE